MNIIDKLIEESSKELDKISVDFTNAQRDKSAKGLIHREQILKDIIGKAMAVTFKLNILSSVRGEND